jgi:hypothetical protein
MYGVGKVHSRDGYGERAVQDANLQARPRKVSQNRFSVISAFSARPVSTPVSPEHRAHLQRPVARVTLGCITALPSCRG